jgi:hypothetical protein
LLLNSSTGEVKIRLFLSKIKMASSGPPNFRLKSSGPVLATAKRLSAKVAIPVNLTKASAAAKLCLK